MRTLPLLALALAMLPLLAAAPVAAQGVVIPLRCERAYPADGSLPRIPIDSVRMWATLERGSAVTSVDHRFHNGLGGAVDAAFFFPLPADATLNRVSVYLDGALDQYGAWSGPDESRWIAAGIVRDQPEAGLGACAGTALVHVPVRIPAGATRRLQVIYTQPLRVENGTHTYRYPLSAGGAAARAGHVTLGATVTTEAGFRGLRSPSHAVQVEWGTEAGRCRPEAACGFTNVPSRRVKVIRLTPAPGDWARDFELIFTPADAEVERRSVSIP